MKKKFTAFILAIIVLTCSSAFVFKSSNGIAGYTGAPGETTCATFGCHGGGTSPASGVTITSVPSFSLDQYKPDSVYQITIQVAAAGFNRYGFGCEILKKNNSNAGTMQLPGAGVKFLNAFNGRRNAVHTTPKIGATATFTFQWVAPATPDTVRFYVMGNAVNGNGSTSGDFPLAPFSMSITPVPPDTTQNTSGVMEESPLVNKVQLYPNPSGELSQISYHLHKSVTVLIELRDIQGRQVRAFHHGNREAGSNSQVLDLRGVEKGVYFVAISTAQGKTARKLLVVQ